MKCPVCPDTTLQMTERRSIEVDYCPDCRGVWLDRGELDKLIELAAGPGGPRQDMMRSHPGMYDYPREGRPQPRGMRKSWLSELFD